MSDAARSAEFIRQLPERVLQHTMERIPAGRQAAVLLPLIPAEGKPAAEWDVLLEVRSRSIVQGGEICFPGGGRMDNETCSECAVRETSEELLIDREQISVAASLFNTAGPRGTEVFSYLGVLQNYHDTWSHDEVDHILRLPLSYFLRVQPEIHEGELVTRVGEDFPYDQIPGGKGYRFWSIPKTYYFYPTKHGAIWGLTAAILHAAAELFMEDAGTGY